MPGVWLRAVVAVALLLTWLVPGVRLSVLPPERALAAAATELMCVSSVAAVVPAAWNDGAAEPSRSVAAGRPTLADAAAPMQRAFDKQWQTDLTRVGFVLCAVLAVLACARRFAGVAALLVIAAATLYWWAYDPHADAYRLLLVTQSLPLWWHAISQWTWALQAERLVAPVTMWLALIGACWLLWRAESGRPRGAASAAHPPLRNLSRGRT